MLTVLRYTMTLGGDIMNQLRKDVNAVLFALLGSEELVTRWWIGDNLAFGLVPPQEVWDQGEEGQERVAAYVFTHGYR
mgnify:CR=1 FL=1